MCPSTSIGEEAAYSRSSLLCQGRVVFQQRHIWLRSSRRSVKELGVFEQRSRSVSVAGPNNEALPCLALTHRSDPFYTIIGVYVECFDKDGGRLLSWQKNRSPAFPQQPSNLQMFFSARDSSISRAAGSAH